MQAKVRKIMLNSAAKLLLMTDALLLHMPRSAVGGVACAHLFKKSSKSFIHGDGRGVFSQRSLRENA